MNKNLYYISNGILILIGVIYFALSFLNMEIDATNEFFESLLFPLVAFIIGGFFVYLAKVFDWKSNLGRVWVTLGGALFLWGFADLLWYYFLLIGEEPFPSLADVFYLLGYPLIFIGLFYMLKELEIEIDKRLLLVYTGIFIIFSITVLYLLVPLIATDNLLETTAGLGYPLGDILILYFSVLVLVIFVLRGGNLKYSWIMVVLAFVLNAIADLIFTWDAWGEGLYAMFAFDILDAFFLSAYLLLGLAGLAYYNQYQEALK